MRFYRYPVFIIRDPKIQLTVLFEDTAGNNGGIKFKTIESPHGAGHLFPACIGNTQGVDAILQEILDIKFITDAHFGNIDTTTKVVYRHKIKHLTGIRKYAF